MSTPPVAARSARREGARVGARHRKLIGLAAFVGALVAIGWLAGVLS